MIRPILQSCKLRLKEVNYLAKVIRLEGAGARI